MQKINLVLVLVLWFNSFPIQGISQGQTPEERAKEKMKSALAEAILDGFRTTSKTEGGRLDEPIDEFADVNPITKAVDLPSSLHCMDQALEHVFSEMGNIEKVEKHMLREITKLKKGKKKVRDFYKHLSRCHQICGNFLAYTLACHVDFISRQEKEFVFFDNNRAEIKPIYRQPLKDLALKLRSSEFIHYKMLIIGRASHVGSKDYNRQLSQQRVDVVKHFLVSQGVPESQVSAIWLGWEPPQIGIHGGINMRKLYGLPSNMTDHEVNRSSMVVIYDPKAL